MNGENYQPVFNIQIPPPRVITPPLPPRTPEHQIFSSGSIVSPTTRNESDEETDDDFAADKRDLRNITFDEYVDDDDANDDDDQERVFLDDSTTFDESGEDNSVSLFFFLSV